MDQQVDRCGFFRYMVDKKSVFVAVGREEHQTVKRFGWVMPVTRDELDVYRNLYAEEKTQLQAGMNSANMHNASVYLGQVDTNRHYLFSYYEYIGDDYEADMKRIAQDKVTQVWWTYTEPLQRPLPTRKPGDWWLVMEELVHVK